MELCINEISKREVTICLNMIVKNESKIIERLLKSVLPIIDTYCICDTGSDDNTVEIINDFFFKHDIKGKIIYQEFINFEQTRNYALNAAKSCADYLLLLDADMILEIGNEFDKSKLIDPVYSIRQGDEFQYYNVRLISTLINAQYKGVTHEYIDSGLNSTKICSLKINDIGDGGSKKDKFVRDIKLLTTFLESNPDDIRSNFYLANSYYDIGDYVNALKYYEKHEKVVNWNEEHFYNNYRQGLCYENLEDSYMMAEKFIKAWNIRPQRAESLYELIHYYRCNCEWAKCKLYYQIAKKIQFPKDDILFVHKDIYEHKLLYEYSVFAYYIGETSIYKEMTTLMNNSYYDMYNLLNNYKFYYPLLNNFSNNINISRNFTREINGEKYNFKSSTPSIIKYKDGYGINLRYVNYNIAGNGTYEWVKNIVSINKYLEFDNDLQEKSEIEIQYKYNNRQYEGIEDIKLITDDENIYFTGTAQLSNNNLGVVWGEYGLNKNLIGLEIRKNNINNCEKNWVFIPGKDTKRMIYKWFPLEIYELQENKLENCVTKDMPHIFSHARGSTNGCKFEDEIWFIVHLVHQYEGEPRFYYNMIVKFDLDMNLINYTCPFKFTSEPIEYCCGIVVEKDRILISHSIWDRESYIKVYDKHTINNYFLKN